VGRCARDTVAGMAHSGDEPAQRGAHLGREGDLGD
jgi:hypothetical protein